MAVLSFYMTRLVLVPALISSIEILFWSGGSGKVRLAAQGAGAEDCHVNPPLRCVCVCVVDNETWRAV